MASSLSSADDNKGAVLLGVLAFRKPDKSSIRVQFVPVELEGKKSFNADQVYQINLAMPILRTAGIAEPEVCGFLQNIEDIFKCKLITPSVKLAGYRKVFGGENIKRFTEPIYVGMGNHIENGGRGWAWALEKVVPKVEQNEDNDEEDGIQIISPM